MKAGNTPLLTTALFLVGTIAVEPAAVAVSDWSRLLKHAVPTSNSWLDHRLLEQTESDSIFARYAVRFERCHEVSEDEYLRAFGQPPFSSTPGVDDGDLVELPTAVDDGDLVELPTAVARSGEANLPNHPNKIRRLVVFRLCPVSPDLPPFVCSDSCEDSVYGEYILDIQEYLDAVVAIPRVVQEVKCSRCYEHCSVPQPYAEEEDGGGDDSFGVGGRELDNYNVDCDSCDVEWCMKVENMEDNGYVDATEFAACQMIYDSSISVPKDDPLYQAIGDLRTSRYAGPTCASGGTKINIGLFRDEDCYSIDDKTGLDVEDFLVDDRGWNVKLSHHMLRKTYDECMPCDFELTTDSIGTKSNVCRELYTPSQKCELSWAGGGPQDPACGFLASLDDPSSHDQQIIDIDALVKQANQHQVEILVFSIVAMLLLCCCCYCLCCGSSKKSLRKGPKYSREPTIKMEMTSGFQDKPEDDDDDDDIDEEEEEDKARRTWGCSRNARNDMVVVSEDSVW